MLRSRLLLYFAIISLIPIFVLSIFFYYSFSSHIQNYAIQSNTELLDRISGEIDSLYGYMTETSNQIQHTFSYKNILRNDYDRDDDRVMSEIKTNVELLVLAEFRPLVSGLYILGDNGVRLKSTFFSFREDDYTDKDWYQKTHDADGLIYLGKVMNSNITKNYKESTLTFGLPFVDNATGKKMGIIIFEIVESVFQEILGTQSEINGSTAILDDEGNVIVSLDENHISDERVGDYISELNKNRDYGTAGYQPASSDGGDTTHAAVEEQYDTYNECLIMHSPIDCFGWKIVSIIPQSEFVRDLNTVIPGIFLAVSIVGVIIVILVVNFSRQITRPIKKLSDSMMSVESGDFSVHVETHSKDEIGMLSGNFNTMVKEINDLIKSIQTAEEKRRIAELKALQAQINPHFLYNTLDSIIWLSRIGTTEQVVQLTEALTNLFRISISKGRDIITIEEELKHVENYIIIQKIRYQDEFDYSVQCDPALFKYMTMKLILQPLVENAIYHGIKTAAEPGFISVSVYEDGDDVVFEVKDRGLGMPPEIMENLKRMLGNEASGGKSSGSYGLVNINDRIKILFGLGYGITFTSTYGEGSTFWIRIPKTEEGYDL